MDMAVIAVLPYSPPTKNSAPAIGALHASDHFISRMALPDRDLLTQLDHAVKDQCRATAQVIALLMEVDSRKLHQLENCSSLFAYCVQVLHLAESAAYLQIEAARVARRFPAILERIADGSLHLTTVNLLAPLLTDANHLDLLDAATHKNKLDVDELIERMNTQTDTLRATSSTESSRL
jgi:hypothetical protein